MSFLQRPDGCSHREDGDAVALKKSMIDTCAPAAGSGSTFLPILRLIRDPARAVESILDVLRPGSNAELSAEERAEMIQLEQRRQILYANLRNAGEYTEWRLAASELDLLEHNDDWKDEFESPDYDAPLVELRLKELDDARISCDAGRMLALIRTSLTRGLGDMGNIRLYMHSHTGTKRLIERYISSALATLQALLDISAKQNDERLSPRFMLEQVLCARQAFGRSALLLSGGGTFGMNHIGVLKSLWEARLLPRIISGASAGSIVSAVICTRTDEEIPELLDTFCYGDLAVFERPDDEDSALRRVGRFLKIGALFDITHLIRVMHDLLGDLTFQEAYNRTRRILNICVSSASLYELPRLLNYVSAPNVLIWSAVAASCSVPFVFSATSLLAKDPKTGEAVPWNPTPQHYIDGSVDNDLPMTRLAEMFNVNHFIVSQVNPHVVPFLVREEELVSAEGQTSYASSHPGPGWLYTMTTLAKTEALHRLNVLADLGIFPTTLSKVRSVLNQKYSGDITILPEISYADFHLALTNPTPEFMLNAMLTGERATWPKLTRIRNHCAIELALDDAIQKLRTRAVFSPSQMDLRLMVGVDRRLRRNRSRERLDNPNRRKEPSHPSKQMPGLYPTVTAPTPSAPPRKPFVLHPKSHSIDVVEGTPTKPAAPATLHPGLALKLFSGLETIPSGTEETSNATLSERDDTEAASMSSPSTPSPSSPSFESSLPLSHRLFPHASNPGTPSLSGPFKSSQTSFSPFIPPPPSALSSTSHADAPLLVPAPTHQPQVSSQAAKVSAATPSLLPNASTSRSSLSMTTPAQANSPEAASTNASAAAFKRLFLRSADAKSFDPGDGNSNATSQSSYAVVPSAGPGSAASSRRGSTAFDLDISGTRGMVLRKKSSMNLQKLGA